MVECDVEEIEKNISMAPFICREDYLSSIFKEKYKVVFYSTLSEMHSGVYKNKKTGFKICFGSCNYSLLDRDNWKGYINGTIPNHNYAFNEEILSRFEENYEFEGRRDVNDVIEDVYWLRNHLPSETILVLLLGSEKDPLINSEEFSGHGISYKVLNDEIKKSFSEGIPRTVKHFQ